MAETTKDKIRNVLDSLIENKRVVFWYDEGGRMVAIAESIELPGVEKLTLDGNPFSIKYRILTGEQPERGFLIYSQQFRPDDEDNWLLDMEVSGAVFSADMGSLYAAECGIPMELKHRLVDPYIEFFKDAENRRNLTSRLASGMNETAVFLEMMGVAANVDATIEQMLLQLAYELQEDKTTSIDRFERYGFSKFFWNEIKASFGYTGQESVKDLMIVLFRDDMNRFHTQPKLSNAAHIFMRDWRDSRKFGNSYHELAKSLEQELSIPTELQSYTLDELIKIETFPCVDKLIASHLQHAVLNDTMNVAQIENIVRDREFKVFWKVAAHTIKALLESRRVIELVRQYIPGLLLNSVEEAFKFYTSQLYKIDFHYRRFFREANQAESTNLIAPVSELVQRVYTTSYLDEIARKWQPLVDGMRKWKFDGISSQQDFYRTHVHSFIDQKKKRLFVIISDAMRYETMVELQQRIEALNRTETQMRPAMVSTLPSYTQLGMASLLPHRELSYNKPQDEIFVDGMSSKGTDARQKIIQQYVPKSRAISAKDFLEITSPKTAFKEYDLIYIYSNRIDFTGDKRDTEGDVFKATEEEFDQIVKIVELIRNGNGTNILITSDHGYIYQNEVLDESEFSDFKAEGNLITDTRRFIIGNNLKRGNVLKTWNSEDVGLLPGREIQIAKGMTRMRKQGSGSRFVHGGSMLQEIVVPVLHVNIKKSTNISQVDVDVLSHRARITTNKQTIGFYQTEPVTEKVTPITLRIGFYDDAGNLLSDSPILTFATQSEDSTQREQKHVFIFQNQLSRLNGKDITLKLERQVPNTDQFVPYKEEKYRVNVMFANEF